MAVIRKEWIKSEIINLCLSNCKNLPQANMLCQVKNTSSCKMRDTVEIINNNFLTVSDNFFSVEIKLTENALKDFSDSYYYELYEIKGSYVYLKEYILEKKESKFYLLVNDWEYVSMESSVEEKSVNVMSDSEIKILFSTFELIKNKFNENSNQIFFRNLLEEFNEKEKNDQIISVKKSMIKNENFSSEGKSQEKYIKKDVEIELSQENLSSPKFSPAADFDESLELVDTQEVNDLTKKEKIEKEIKEKPADECFEEEKLKDYMEEEKPENKSFISMVGNAISTLKDKIFKKTEKETESDIDNSFETPKRKILKKVDIEVENNGITLKGDITTFVESKPTSNHDENCEECEIADKFEEKFINSNKNNDFKIVNVVENKNHILSEDSDSEIFGI